MKYFLLGIIFLLSLNTTKSQSLELPGLNGKIDNLETVNVRSLSGQFPQAKFLYNTDKGKVYTLPLDNMPCLVPNELFVFNEHNNYRQFYPPNSIPNPYPKIEIIPKAPNEKISIYKNTPQITK